MRSVLIQSIPFFPYASARSSGTGTITPPMRISTACLNYWDEVHEALRRDTDLQQRVEVGGGSPMGGDQIAGAFADLELLAQGGIVMVCDDNVIEEAFPKHLYT